MQLLEISTADGGQATINPAHIVELRNRAGGCSVHLSTGRTLELSPLEARRMAAKLGLEGPDAGERIQENAPSP